MCGALTGSKNQLETIKGLAYLTLSHFVDVAYFRQDGEFKNSIEISQLLKGFYIENVWGILDFQDE